MFVQRFFCPTDGQNFIEQNIRQIEFFGARTFFQHPFDQQTFGQRHLINWTNDQQVID